jgi:predicted RNA-binding protein Jag
MKEIISTEGETLSAAIILAAEKFGTNPKQIEYSFDSEHFKTASGKNKGVDPVKISAWVGEPKDMAGAEAAVSWLAKLTTLINIETKIDFRLLGDKEAELTFTSENGGRLVGRKGTSLRSIKIMLLAAMKAEHSDWTYKLEVSGGKRADEGRDRNRDRNSYRDRDRDRDRDRSRDRNRDRGGKQSRGGRLSGNDIKNLEKLAHKLSMRVIDTNEPLLIRQVFNSFERRVIHLKVKQLDGVNTESIMDDGVKKIKIVPVATENSSTVDE